MVDAAVVYSQAMFYGQWAFATLIFGLFIWWVYVQYQYKIAAEIYRPIGDNQYNILTDKIRVYKRNGVNYYYLKKAKEEIPYIQEYKSFKLTGSMFGAKYRIKLFNPIPGTFYVIDGLNFDSKAIQSTVIPGDLQMHLSDRVERAKEVYSNKKKWEVFLPYIGLAAIIVLFIIVVYLILQRMDVLTAEWSGNTKSFLELMKSCRGVQDIPNTGA